MTEQAALTLISASFGFIAAIFFCIGSALTTHKKMVALSRTYWGANLEFAKATVSQSTQYGIGALLLIISFGLQIMATQASATTQATNDPINGHYSFIVVSTTLLVGGLSWLLYLITNKHRYQKVEAELKRESSA